MKGSARQGLERLIRWTFGAGASVVVALSGPTAGAQSRDPSAPPVGLRGSIGDQTLPGLPQAPQPAPALPPAAPLPQTPGAPAATVALSLSAQLSDDSPKIDTGMVWHVFQDSVSADGRAPRHAASSKAHAPTFQLQPGTYLVVAGYGRARTARRIVLRPGRAVEETIVLNAGGLRVTAVLADNEPVPAGLVSYEIFSDERDQSGNRTRIAGPLPPGVVVRLNAGLYNLVSSYGDANVLVRADVTVEAGKMSEATVTHAAGRVTFKLVAKPGGEAIADTRWTIATLASGAMVKESAGAFPSHALAPGNYSATARSGDKSYRRDFSVSAGDNVEVEIVMN